MTDERLANERLDDALADRYLLEDELGRGASAVVYLAQDLRHGRRVAPLDPAARPGSGTLRPLLRFPSWITPPSW